jgi:hypothetical protein
MPALTPEQAYDSLNRLEASIRDIPGADKKSGRGTASTIDQLGHWAARIRRGDMSPDALPTQYQAQAGRHGRNAPLHDAIRAEEMRLRRERGESPGYGARWYFGKHRTEYDD